MCTQLLGIDLRAVKYFEKQGCEHLTGDKLTDADQERVQACLDAYARRVVNKVAGAVEWIKEGKQTTQWTRLSCHRFRANEVRLQLSVLAYNRGNLWRRLGLPQRIKSWSLTS